MKKLTSAVFLLYLILVNYGCKKQEGEGGSSTIEGKVYYNFKDHNNRLISRNPAPDEDVYIMYGDNEYYDDDTETHFDGSYRFDYLRKGKYTVYAYSECMACPEGSEVITMDVSISDKNQQVTVPDIEIDQYLDIDDGSGTIMGKVYEKVYVGNLLIKEYYKANTDVFILYEDDPVYFDDMDTGEDGTYIFKELIPGKYTVYAYSDCDTCASGKMAVKASGEFMSGGEVIELSDIIINDYK